MHPVLSRPFTPETRALLAKMTPAPPGSRMRLIDNAVRSMIAQGVWNKFGFLYVHAAHTSQAALLNWVNPSSAAATEVSSPTFTADRGYTGNGTTSYVETGILHNAIAGGFARDSAHAGIWNLTAGNNISALGLSSTSQLGLAPASTAGGNERVVRLNGTTAFSFDDNITTGYLVAVRRDSANLFSYRNGGSEQTGASPSIAPGANTVRIGYSNGSFYTGQVAIAHAGDQLTAAQVAALYAILQSYLRGVGAL